VLVFSVGGASAGQLSVTLDGGPSRQEIAQRFDRALAPLKVRAQLDDRGQLLFSTDKANWPAVKDSIAISGRGRVATQEEAPPLDPQAVDTGNVEALRQSLREVVQALARVRRWPCWGCAREADPCRPRGREAMHRYRPCCPSTTHGPDQRGR
jgi:glycine/D-amino acid oxidase-like deaminating enzyme